MRHQAPANQASAKQIRLDAFDMNCVGHQSSGLRRHPRDRDGTDNRLGSWTDPARTPERGLFDGLFPADVPGTCNVFGGTASAALRNASQVPVNDPAILVFAMAAVAPVARARPRTTRATRLAVRDVARNIFTHPDKVHRVQLDGEHFRLVAMPSVRALAAAHAGALPGRGFDQGARLRGRARRTRVRGSAASASAPIRRACCARACSAPGRDGPHRMPRTAIGPIAGRRSARPDPATQIRLRDRVCLRNRARSGQIPAARFTRRQADQPRDD